MFKYISVIHYPSLLPPNQALLPSIFQVHSKTGCLWILTPSQVFLLRRKGLNFLDFQNYFPKCRTFSSPSGLCLRDISSTEIRSLSTDIPVGLLRHNIVLALSNTLKEFIPWSCEVIPHWEIAGKTAIWRDGDGAITGCIILYFSEKGEICLRSQCQQDIFSLMNDDIFN